MVTRSIALLAFLLAGPLADNLFEPLMLSPHGLFGTVGLVIGIGTGRGMGLLFSLMGLVIATVAMIGAFIPAIRNVEEA